MTIIVGTYNDDKDNFVPDKGFEEGNSEYV